MNLITDNWQLILLLLAFFGAPTAVAASQRGWLNRKFEEQEKTRAAASAHWEQRFSETSNLARRTERELLEFMREVAENCVMQKDYVRNQTVLELKIDACRNETQLLRVDVKALETETRERT